MSSEEDHRTTTSTGPTFLLELENDPIKNNELGEVTDPLENITNLQAGDDQGPHSYLSFVATTIEVVKPRRTFVVWRANFHPAVGRRFRIATITCKFSKSLPTTQAPSIIGHAPRKAFGGCSESSKKIHWGIELPISFLGGPATAGITPSSSVDTEKEVQHAFTITGTARGIPKKTTCVWTVEENGATRRGIPSEIQFAMILEHEGPFLCEVNVSGRDGGVLSRWIRTSTPIEKRQKAIDPETYKGLLTEYNFEDMHRYDEMLQKWSGEVQGAVVQFLQPVVGQ